MKFGTTDIKKIKFGTDDIKKVFYGSAEIWSDGPELVRDHHDLPMTVYSATNPLYSGVRVITKSSLKLVSVEKYFSNNASHCYIYTDTGVLLAQAPRVDNIATFDLDLQDNTIYRIISRNSDGSSATSQGTGSGIKSVAGVNIDWYGPQSATTPGGATSGSRYLNIIAITTHIR